MVSMKFFTAEFNVAASSGLIWSFGFALKCSMSSLFNISVTSLGGLLQLPGDGVVIDAFGDAVGIEPLPGDDVVEADA